jgi:hypothetical protein
MLNISTYNNFTGTSYDYDPEDIALGILIDTLTTIKDINDAAEHIVQKMERFKVSDNRVNSYSIGIYNSFITLTMYYGDNGLFIRSISV